MDTAVERGRRRRDWLLAIGLMAAVLLAYQQVWNGQPLWDDNGHLTKPELRSADGLVRIWTEPGATQQYYPLVHTVFWLEQKIWGDATVGYHLVNILVHIGAALLLVKLLRRLEVSGAWLAGAVWALHPVQVESVAWISELKNTLSGVCYLASALVYLRFDRERKQSQYALALALFVGGLLAKTVVATLPAALLLVFWWKRNRLGWKKDVTPLVPFFAAGIGLGLFTAWMERTTIIAGDAAHYHLPWVGRLLVAGRDIWFYLEKLVWPNPLMFIYPRWDINAAVAWQYLFPAGALLLTAALWVGQHRFGRAPLVAFLFFAGTLFPALGFFDAYPFIYSYVADHFQYLACIGPLALAAAGMERGLNWAVGRHPHLPPIGCAGVLAVLWGVSWDQCGQYSDNETLFRATLAKNPQCWMADINLGVILMNRGKLDDAENRFQTALRLHPDDAEGHADLGNLFGQRGQLPDAIAQFRAALKLHPEFAEARCNLGIALMQQGDVAQAAVEFRHALESEPNYLPAREFLGQALLRTGDFAGALDCFGKIMALPPDPLQKWYGLGNRLLEQSRFPEAIACYRQVLQINPRFAPGWAYLGVASYQNGQSRDAVDAWQKFLEFNPSEPQVLNNLALVLATSPDATLRNGPKAVTLAELASRASGGSNPEILSTLAAAYAEAGRYVEAATTARNALNLSQRQGNDKLSQSIQEEIKLYDSSQPMRRGK